MPVTRTDPPYAGSERDILVAYVNFLRDTILLKLDGLDDEQVRQPHQPSGLTLLGMVKHLAYVERHWFQSVFLGNDVAVPWTQDDPDADWRIEPHESTQDIIGLYRNEIGISNRIATEFELDAIARNVPPAREGLQLRWILVHMIEETARHCGHADLIREAIDGQTGE